MQEVEGCTPKTRESLLAQKKDKSLSQQSSRKKTQEAKQLLDSDCLEDIDNLV